MPRASGQKDYISLVRGLITEASPLAFPEGATTDEINFLVDRDGMIRRRRRGFDKVGDNNIISGNFEVESVFYWRGPGLVCVVVTKDTPETVLRFHAVDEDFTFIVEIPISDKVCVTQAAQTTKLLVITTDTGDNPVLCEYNKESEEISVNDLSLYVRDFELVDDGLSASDRPAVLTENHRYNLYNSGWYQTKKDERAADAEKAVLTAFFDYTAKYPSNSDVIGVGLIIDADGNSVFDAEYVEQADFGNSLSARGHFVYNILNIDRTVRNASPTVDGTPSTTISSVGTASLAGTPSYDPDDSGNPGNPTPPGGRDPFIPPTYDDEGRPIFIP